MILAWIAEALDAGARLERACEVIGLDVRTVQRWRGRGEDGGDDRRSGPKTPPTNALSEAERAEVLSIARSAEFRDATPKTIVPTLADRGRYLASESTFYRELRKAGEMTHRGRARPATPRAVPTHTATSPNQVWSWDITKLLGPQKWTYYYLYTLLDIFSRYTVAAGQHAREFAGESRRPGSACVIATSLCAVGRGVVLRGARLPSCGRTRRRARRCRRDGRAGRPE